MAVCLPDSVVIESIQIEFANSLDLASQLPNRDPLDAACCVVLGHSLVPSFAIGLVWTVANLVVHLVHLVLLDASTQCECCQSIPIKS